MIGLLRWLPLSVAVHAAALGGAVWLVRGATDVALFIDLTLEPSRGEEERSATSGASGVQPRLAPRATRSASAPVRAPFETEPAASPPPRVASPPPPALSSPPAAPPPAAAVDAAALPSLDGATPADAAVESGHPTAGQGGVGTSERVTGAGGGDAGGSTRDGAAAADSRVALAVPGDAGGGAYGPYLAALRRRIQESLAYPAAARRRGISGTVHLEILLEPSGVVSDVLVVRSSSYALLDDAAVDAVRGLGRMPFPAGVRPRALRVRLPVVFELR
ncbi:MAG TPA: TonB family protein [Methylomirabilota bacterium]|nr:TonB family protein [Methylomirabilota bacterium]